MPRIKQLHNNYIEARLAKLLKGYMASAGVKQKQIADELNETQQAVSKKLATGKMSAKDLIIILQACDADESDLRRVIKL